MVRDGVRRTQSEIINQTSTNDNPTSSSNDDREEGQDKSIRANAKFAGERSKEMRQSTRERGPSTKYNPNEYVNLTDEGEPQSYKEAMANSHKVEWVKVIQEEIKSLHEHHTCDLVELSKGRRALKNRWVPRLKNKENNPRLRYKVHLVV